MPRDEDHIRRLYGDAPRPKPEPLTYGALPAVWIVGLLLLGLSSAILAIGSLWYAAGSGPSLLQQRGVIEPMEVEVLVVKDPDEQDKGCVITQSRIVRYESYTVVSEMALSEPAQIRVVRDGDRATLIGPSGEISCSSADKGLFERTLRELADARL